MSFVHLSMLAGLALVALPVLIHLINLFRQKRVQWAALEFLLASKKKNERWVRLKELLLLLMRMAAVAAVVLVLAQPLLRNRFTRLLGGDTVHHVVLLDDSFSMSDRFANTTAFDEAKRAIRDIADAAVRQPTRQRLTLLRFSRAGAGGTAVQPDLNEATVDAEFVERLSEVLEPLAASQMAVDVVPALETARRLFEDKEDENRLLYIVSDFRERDWDRSEGLVRMLEETDDWTSQLELVQCVDRARPNLAITALAPKGGTYAASVRSFMEVTVRNHGDEPVTNVSVLLRENGQERSSVSIDRIEPGKEETREFEVYFAKAGPFLVEARLEADAIAADNVRYALLEVPLELPVLLVDGDPDAINAKFFATALAPGGNVRTGISTQIEAPTFLIDQTLDKYAAIYLLNVDRIDSRAVTKLEAYIRAGGGLALFVGPKSQAAFMNDSLYRGGEGFMPLAVQGETQLLVDRLEPGPDLEVVNHPLFAIFAGERNSFLYSVGIERFFKAQRDWQPDADRGERVLAKLRNGDPLVVERPFGAGRVVAVLTTAAPVWNNWGRNPSFVVFALELQAYLSQPRQASEERTVGTPLVVELAAGEYQPRLQVRTPQTGAVGSFALDAEAKDDQLHVRLAETPLAGMYELQLTTTRDEIDTRRYAFNVDTSESNLAVLSERDIEGRLENVDFEYRRAGDTVAGASQLAGTNLSDAVLYFLVALLVGEQALAYAASYHRQTPTEARR